MRRWSKRLEAVGKDVECTFGIMKKRFRILRLPFLFKTEDEITNVFRVCAMLHNRLLEHDGLDGIGKAEEDWLAADLSTDDARIFAQVAANQDAARQRHMPAGTGEEDAVDDDDPEDDHFALRRALVTHFEHAWGKKEIMWKRSAAMCRARQRARDEARDARREDGLEEEDEDVEVEEEGEDEGEDDEVSEHEWDSDFC